MPDAYPAGHGWTPPARSFGPARCKVLLTRYPCFYAREEHDPSLPPEDVDFSGRRRKARGALGEDIIHIALSYLTGRAP